MVESYKFKSKLATAIGGIATIISVLGIDQLTQIFPGYGQYIPVIVSLATWYLSQTTENKRVEVAEELAVQNYQVQHALEPIDGTEPVLNPEYESDGA